MEEKSRVNLISHPRIVTDNSAIHQEGEYWRARRLGKEEFGCGCVEFKASMG